MTPFFDIALAVVGSASTLAAFGGKTTEDGPEPLPKRITTRGKVSLACLALTLGLGVIKVHETNVEDRQKTERDDAVRKMETAEANARQSTLKQQLVESIGKADAANRKADDANIRLQGLETIDNTNLARLGETKTTLAEVRKTLGNERDEMSMQSAATLVTSFANSNENVRDVWIYLPLTKQVSRASSITNALFPSFEQDVCSDLVGLSLEVILHSGGDYETTTFERSDSNLSHRDFIGGMQHLDELDTFKNMLEDENGGALLTAMKETSTNGQLYGAGFHASKGHPIPAAQLYASLSRPGIGGIALVTDWPRVFKDKKSYEELKAKYPEILTGKWNGDPEQSAEYAAANGHPFPEDCKAQIKSYFKRAFDKALVIAVVDREPYETMIFPLRVLPVEVSDDYVTLAFGSSTTPSFSLSSDTQLRTFSDAWKEGWPQ